ncbi:MAG: chemotaxis protein CheW [Deltaproteobacteria bacterium]|nr:chemotaxis protein CheW [Deltaproteobacteria bacterium]
MSTGDDETLKAYIDESLEHLAGIETDLLEIEKAGSDIDVERVNKVFRAAHSIKGGAGFIGLHNIKTLSHHMESVLGLIRNKKLIPNPENINFLLLASDALKDLLIHVEESDEMNISDPVEALSSITDSPEPPLQETVLPPPETPVLLSLPDGRRGLSVSHADLEHIRDMKQGGKSVYLLGMPLPQDAQNEEQPGLGVLEEARSYGNLLVHQLDTTQPPGTLIMLFACILDPEDVAKLFEIEPDHVYEVSENGKVLLPDNPLQNRQVNQEIEDPEKSASPRISTEPLKTSAAKAEIETKPTPFEHHASSPETSLRVNVALLDSLMTLAGELVLGRNQLLQSLSRKDLDSSEAVSKRIDHITSELQEAIMRTRMQPIGNVFNKFPRVARDLARNLGKEVELTLEGKDVELDKTLIEAIADPLTHLVRNAIDHGIETPDRREKKGKHPIGRIRLKAFHEAGQVNIEIKDDGRGLDGTKLAAEAVEKGFITREQSGKLSLNEKIQLIFLPGFSMAHKVTDLSGRGVGMDVVKTNLDRLGGQIDLDTEIEVGTTIRIKVPLTLAIIPSQIVLTENERYAIPQVNLVELIRVPANQIRKRVEIVGDAEVVRLRSRLLPLVRLSDMLGLRRTFTDPEKEKTRTDRRKRIADRRSRRSHLFGSFHENQNSNEKNSSLNGNDDDSSTSLRSRGDRRYRVASGLNIAVVSSGEMKYGLVVDALFDSEEIVVHPLGRHLKPTKGYAGATIMGDGKVALILDVMELAQLAELSSVHESTRAKELAREKAAALEVGKDRQSLLAFRNAPDEHFAVPLNQVLRIEKISAGDVEVVGGRKVMQYRGGNLLLFTIDQVASVKPIEEKGHLMALVFTLAGREIGLLATGPVDAFDINEKMDGKALKQPGIMGSVVIEGQTTLLVDVFDIISTLNPDWFSEKKDPKKAPEASGRILIAEDSNFFRDQLKSFIEDEGYVVIEAKDGLEAWKLLEKQVDSISLVVTDLEMPNMDGFGLAEKIKSDKRYRHLPVIALTTLAEDDDIARGRKVGIDDYQIKLDRAKLMDGIDRFMRKN